MQEINIINCKNCGNSFAGKFCNNCGEKVYTDHDKSFAHILKRYFISLHTSTINFSEHLFFFLRNQDLYPRNFVMAYAIDISDHFRFL
jgi:hypothetical protein